MSLVQDGPTYSRPVCIPDSYPSCGNSSCSHSDRKALPYQYPCWDDCRDPNSRASDPSQVVIRSGTSHAPSRRGTRLLARAGEMTKSLQVNLGIRAALARQESSRLPLPPMSPVLTLLKAWASPPGFCPLPVSCPCPAIYLVEICAPCSFSVSLHTPTLLLTNALSVDPFELLHILQSSSLRKDFLGL